MEGGLPGPFEFDEGWDVGQKMGKGANQNSKGNSFDAKMGGEKNDAKDDAKFVKNWGEGVGEKFVMGVADGTKDG